MDYESRFTALVWTTARDALAAEETGEIAVYRVYPGGDKVAVDVQAADGDAASTKIMAALGLGSSDFLVRPT
jgi:hypothetical protein